MVAVAASFSASECAHSGVVHDRIHVGHLAPEIAGDQAQADGTSGGFLPSRVAFQLLCRNRKLLHITTPPLNAHTQTPGISAAVTARKDDAAAADQAATAKLAVSVSSGWDGGLIQTTSG